MVGNKPCSLECLERHVREEPRAAAATDFQQTVLGTEPRAAPALSNFSSRGPSQSYPGMFKPDIMAPGVWVLAAYSPYPSKVLGTIVQKHIYFVSPDNIPIRRDRCGTAPTDIIADTATLNHVGNNMHLSSDYYLISGTSMACPHISGITALLKAAHPEWSPAAIQSAMMTTANPRDNTNQPIKDMGYGYQVATPLGIGEGQVHPNRALDLGLIYDATMQDYANLVCSMNFTTAHAQTIIRSSYNCSSPFSDLNYPSFIVLYETQETRTTSMRKFRRTLTNVGNGSAAYKVKVEEPNGSTITVSPQTLMFTRKYEKQSYSLTIRYTISSEFVVAPGSITWIEENGKHTVRSPIVVSAH
ncbi:Subtilisin-like protease SBT3 [Sesamum angolense]|uniref:Subtilisin-like protease SBT3 n=1 Tax=Sesamum angolense TaxID=2727404 RepID=A0AAE1T6G3_9LAMI|nr:Subtilisin-like protease SBT3 [Sesamum angolense]